MATPISHAVSTNPLLRGIAFSAAAFACFSTADAITKQLSAHYSVFQIVFTMALAALLPIGGTLFQSGALHHLRPRRPGLVLLRGALAALAGIMAWNAYSLMPLAEAYALLFTAPMLVTAMAGPLLGEIIGWRRWSAVLVGFLGVVVMIRPGFGELHIGHLLALGAAITAAMSFILLRRIGTSESRGTMLLVVIFALLLATGPVVPQVFIMPTANDFMLMVLGGTISGVGQIGMVQAFREAPAALITPFQYTQMLWALLYGYVLFGDSADPLMLLGAGIVMASGLFILWRETVTRAARPARA